MAQQTFEQGKQISAKWEGHCKVKPEHKWSVGNAIFYKKINEQSITCNNEVCFNNQVAEALKTKPEAAPKQEFSQLAKLDEIILQLKQLNDSISKLQRS